MSTKQALKELCTIRYGASSGLFREGEDIIHILRPSMVEQHTLCPVDSVDTKSVNLSDSLKSRMVHTNDVILACRCPFDESGNMRAVVITEEYEDMLPSSDFITLTPNEELINPEYLVNFLSYNLEFGKMCRDSIAENAKKSKSRSGVIPNTITSTKVFNYVVDIPSLEEQIKLLQQYSEIEKKRKLICDEKMEIIKRFG